MSTNNSNNGKQGGRRPSNNRGGKKRYNNKNRSQRNNNQGNNKPITPRVKHKQKQGPKVETFPELNYTDKVILALGVITLLMSVGLWFMGHREEATYIGIWVPGIFSAGTFFRGSLVRAKRK